VEERPERAGEDEHGPVRVWGRGRGGRGTNHKKEGKTEVPRKNNVCCPSTQGEVHWVDLKTHEKKTTKNFAPELRPSGEKRP